VAKPNRIRELLEARPAERSTVSFYLAADTVRKVKALAASRGITASQVVEILLEQGLAEYEKMAGGKRGTAACGGTSPAKRRRRAAG
jgi:hypothetical protein